MSTVNDLLGGRGGVVYAVAPDDPVLSAVQSMADHSIGALLVMKGDELVGILSERDYARKVILKGRSSAETPVWQIMTSPVVTVRPGDSVSTCMMLMTERKFRHLPVVDGNRVIGMLSIGDLLKAALEEKQREVQQLQQYIAS